MKHNLKENAYLLNASNMTVLQKILEAEWQPLGYYIAASNCSNIPAANTLIILLENIFTLVVSVYILMIVIMLLI